jgi:hypothetical protein
MLTSEIEGNILDEELYWLMCYLLGIFSGN